MKIMIRFIQPRQFHTYRYTHDTHDILLLLIILNGELVLLLPVPDPETLFLPVPGWP